MQKSKIENKIENKTVGEKEFQKERKRKKKFYLDKFSCGPKKLPLGNEVKENFVFILKKSKIRVVYLH